MSWEKICLPSEIPLGAKKDFKIKDHHILVYHLESGWKASVIRCPHAGAMMHICEVENDCIECCFHGWVFDLDTGACRFPEGGPSLKVFPTELRQDGIYVNLS